MNKALKTFHHAVEVTRALGIKYLWIDALCIKQPIGVGEASDWDIEARLMGQVFGSAYCTIAATLAEDWKMGFLKPELPTELRRPRHDDGFLTDFHNDVDAGPLNQRGWVLQERVLSRRTIHFTRHSIYWTCGRGVAGEDSGRIAYPSSRERLYLDPDFPSCLKRSTYDATIEAIQSLFEKYARSVLSKKLDRAVAIYGLLDRMKTVLGAECRFGVFAHFLPRLLLWRRPDEADSNELDYKDQVLPSWSWMTYTRISFPLAKPSLRVSVDTNLKFDPKRNNVLLVEVRALQNCEQKKQESNHFVLEIESKKVGDLWFDTTNGHFRQCIVIATTNGKGKDTTCYILLVRNTSGNQYERVGLGEIKACYVSKESSAGELC